MIQVVDEPVRIPRVFHTYEQARRVFLFALFAQTLLVRCIPREDFWVLTQGVHVLGDEVLFLYSVENGRATA